MGRSIAGIEGWLMGQSPRSRRLKWWLRLLFFGFVALVGGFVWLGPGALLMPFAPRGFETVSDGSTRVYYQTQGDTAREMMGIVQRSRRSIFAFWGDSAESDALEGVKVYLGETPAAYYRLTGNNAGGSAMFGSVLAINLAKVGERHSMVELIDHELAHIYLRRRFGYLTKHLAVPMWFDEGSALLIQQQAPFMARFPDNVRQRPRLVSVRQLRYATDWERMYSVEGGSLTGLHYGYVGWFVDYLRQVHGIEKLRRYLDSMSLGTDPEELFAEVFGDSLATVEERWMAMQKEAGDIPGQTAYVPLPTVPGVAVKWSILLGLLLLAGLWLFRQVCRAVRYAAAAVLPRASSRRR